MELSRKQFVAGAAAATALAGIAQVASAEEARPDWMPEAWDRECDVVVVGTGSIISAALRADTLGLDVLVLEKHPTWFGGTTAFSGGGMSCPNSTQALALGNREIPRDQLMWAETPEGNPIAIKARYAVVLGTGGFDHNREMMANYINHPIYSTPAIPTNTGDGHIMAMEVGANMKSMNEVFNHTVNMMGHPDLYESVDLSLEDGTYCCEQRNKAWATIGCTGSIMVNRRGQRFCCEGGSYDLLGRAFDAYDNSTRDWLNIPGYLVFDGTYTGAFGFGAPTLKQLLAEGELPEWLHAFDTMEDLADGMGIDKESLLATVARWNEMCEEGVDLDWHRGEEVWDRYTTGDASRVESGELKNPCMAPLVEGPFYCIEIYPSLLTTSGGMEINGNAQVKNVRGEVIPRLYAGSNCIASPTGRGYALSGTANANGFVVGYVAANHIATLQPWE